jgi:hypothetical protein
MGCSLPNWVCPLQTVLLCKRWISSAIGLSRSSTFGIGKSRVPAAGASDLRRVIPTPPHAHARSGDRRRPWCSRSPPGREQERMELSQQMLLRVRRRPRYVLSIRHQTTRPSWRPTDVPAGLTRSEGYCGHHTIGEHRQSMGATQVPRPAARRRGATEVACQATDHPSTSLVVNLTCLNWVRHGGAEVTPLPAWLAQRLRGSARL